MGAGRISNVILYVLFEGEPRLELTSDSFIGTATNSSLEGLSRQLWSAVLYYSIRQDI
jgi:hypothetical protein